MTESSIYYDVVRGPDADIPDLLSTYVRPGSALDTLTFDLHPFSHLAVSEIDEDLSEALFLECSAEISHF